MKQATIGDFMDTSILIPKENKGFEDKLKGFNISLRDWQVEALISHFNHNEKSVVEAGTGSGKSILGFSLVALNPEKRFLIVVPTVVLQMQWMNELVKTFKVVKENEVGLIGGNGKKVELDKRIQIAVVNSIRYVNWKHDKAKFDYTIIDEIHRMFSEENVKFLVNGNFEKVLGLSATFERVDKREKLFEKYVGKISYRMNLKESADRGYVSNFKIVTTPIAFTEEEYNRYNKIDIRVVENLKMFNNDLMLAQQELKKGFKSKMFKEAKELLVGINNRKTVVCKAVNKIFETANIIQRNVGKKIIVFDELQDTADTLYELLKARGDKVVRYHSGLTARTKRENIKKYINDEVDILVSVRALDEGLDVKKTDLGIIMNGNSQRRQFLQRLGRILRVSEGKEQAVLYMLFMSNTIDERYVNKRLKVLSEMYGSELNFKPTGRTIIGGIEEEKGAMTWE